LQDKEEEAGNLAVKYSTLIQTNRQLTIKCTTYETKLNQANKRIQDLLQKQQQLQQQKEKQASDPTDITLMQLNAMDSGNTATIPNKNQHPTSSSTTPTHMATRPSLPHRTPPLSSAMSTLSRKNTSVQQPPVISLVTPPSNKVTSKRSSPERSNNSENELATVYKKIKTTTPIEVDNIEQSSRPLQKLDANVVSNTTNTAPSSTMESFRLLQNSLSSPRARRRILEAAISGRKADGNNNL
jgi:hypothetical protein